MVNGGGIMTTTIATPAASPPDLETRVANHKRDLIAKLVELKADTQDGAAEARDLLKKRLSELHHLVKEGLVNGWANVSDVTRVRLDNWLTK
jgi:hypothetical protein